MTRTSPGGIGSTKLEVGDIEIGAVEIKDGSTDARVSVTNNRLDVNASFDTTGLATEAKQLADGHNVTVDNSTGANAVNIQDGGNTITVDGTVAVTGSVTANAGTNLNTSALALETTTTSIKTAVETIDNAIAGTEMQVDVLTMPTVTVTATNLDVQSGGADLATSTQGSAIQTATELIDDTVYVDDADWTADTSKHILAGAVTQVATTANTDGDVTPLTTNAFRELRTAIPESDLATAGTAHVKKYYTSAGAATDGVIWSPAVGKRWYVTDIFIQVSEAATVTLEDDLTAGDSVIWKAELAANSGWSHSFNTPWFSGEDAADLLITTSAGNVYVTVVGYEI